MMVQQQRGGALFRRNDGVDGTVEMREEGHTGGVVGLQGSCW